VTKAEPTVAALSVTNLKKTFQIKRSRSRRKGQLTAVDDVSITIAPGQTLGLVGESGCGKSTLARILAGLETPTGGRIEVAGEPISQGQRKAERLARSARLQMMFQDPYTSLDPRMTVFDLIAEPWVVHRGFLPKDKWRDAARSAFNQVGLDPDLLDSRPTALSGGQRQRVGLARAMAIQPQVLVLDEPVSGLDVSVQAQIIELLRSVQHSSHMAMIFISHDLAVVRSLATQVAVMYLGRIVESGPTEEVFSNPRHPYTVALLSAAPSLTVSSRTNRRILAGEIPSPRDIPSGCSFRTRCWKAQADCAESRPPLTEKGSADHLAACFHPEPPGVGAPAIAEDRLPRFFITPITGTRTNA
jgi:oligopeptide transport system ATP-binding protein